MIWVSIILSVLQALPEIISLIREIMAAIHSKPLFERRAAEKELLGHLRAWHKTGDHEALKTALQGMGRAMGCSSAQ